MTDLTRRTFLTASTAAAMPFFIKAEKKSEAEQKDRNVHLTERNYGVFYRVIELPAGVDASAVQATMANGVLKITIPKPARLEAKKIEVKEAA